MTQPCRRLGLAAAVIIQGNVTASGTGILTTSELAAGGTDVLNLPVNVGTLGTFITNTSAAATFNGVVSGTALDVAGTGTTILNNANTFTGPTLLESGTLSIGNPTGLGSGTLNLVNGTVQASVATTVANPVTLNEASSSINGTCYPGRQHRLTLSGTFTVSGNDAVTLANPAGTTLSGALANTVSTDTLNLVLWGRRWSLGGTGQ